MADANTILTGEPVILRKGLVGTWDGDGSYSDVTQLYGVTEVVLNLNSIGAKRYGDGGKLLATYRRITGGTINLTFAGDLSSLGVLLGITVPTEGVDPEQIRALRLRNSGFPYFGLSASIDTENGEENAVHIFAPKCQINSDSIQVLGVSGGEQTEFRTLSVDIDVLPDDNYIEGAENEVQTLALGSPTTGTYTLTIGNQTTSALAYNANAAAIDAALEALSVVGTGGVAVTSSAPFILTFGGRLANTKLPLLTGVGAGGFDGTIVIARTTAGEEGFSLIAGVYEVEGQYSPELPPLFDV